VLVEELTALGAFACRAVNSGVHFQGERSCGYRANLHSRIASRVLLWVGSGRYRNDDDIYRIARRQDWPARFAVHQRIRVDLSAQGSQVRSLAFLTLRIKDGIVDAFRAHCEQRPSVDTHTPEVRIFGHLDARELHLYLDWSGEALFKRGWRGRDNKGAAPLKENLAAGMLALTRWHPTQPLGDLFCGSGTLLIEAAQRRCGIAPGSQRSFGFERLPDFDVALWRTLQAEAAQQARVFTAQALSLEPLFGMDIAAEELARAQRNAIRAGLPTGAITWQQGDAFLSRCPPARLAGGPTEAGFTNARGLLVSNPPYGERLQRPDNLALGRGLRDRWPGWMLWILSNVCELPALWHMRASHRIALMNGTLPCRLYAFPLRAKVPRLESEDSTMPGSAVHSIERGSSDKPRVLQNQDHAAA
jgi:putative N6-adenine-specific DNA methylase